MADQSGFLIGIKKGDERNAEIHDGQALDLGEVGRRENAPARRTIQVQCCGSGIPYPDPKTATKERGEKNMLSYILGSHKSQN
jgi:hypothetical protein